MKRLRVLGLICLLGLGACAQYSWVPGPAAAGKDFNVAQGQCKLVAMGMPTGDGGFYAQGSPKFVAISTGAYALGSAIGSAVRTQNAFNACMEAQGFVPVQPNQPSTQTGAPPQPQMTPAATPPMAARTLPVVVIEKGTGRILKGSASISPAGGSYQVTDGRVTCGGTYNVRDPSPTITFPTTCSDGRTGVVTDTRDQTGQSAMGTIKLSDGTEASFLAGTAATGY
jgi:hypothetical protein